MSQHVPCVKCATPDPQPVKFTWWGGVIGPKLLHHVKCGRCGNVYNGKTGASNTQGIIIYTLVIMAVAFMIFFGLALIPLLSR